MTLFAYPSKSLLELHCIEALSVRIIPILISRPVISSHIDMSNWAIMFVQGRRVFGNKYGAGATR